MLLKLAVSGKTAETEWKAELFGPGVRTEPRRLDDAFLADIQGCKHVAFLWSHWGNLVFLQWDGRLSKDKANGFTGPILFYFFCCRSSFTINCQPIIVVKRSQRILFDHKDFLKLTIRQWRLASLFFDILFIYLSSWVPQTSNRIVAVDIRCVFTLDMFVSLHMMPLLDSPEFNATVATFLNSPGPICRLTLWLSLLDSFNFPFSFEDWSSQNVPSPWLGLHLSVYLTPRSRVCVEENALC